MLSINFFCRKSKVNRLGLAPVELSIILNGSRTCMLLPRRERPEDFKRLMSQRKDNDLKSFCLAVHRQVQGAMSDMYVKGLSVTPNGLKQYMKGEYVVVYTVGMLCKEYLELLSKRVDADDLTMANYFKYERICERLMEKTGKDADVVSITNAVILGVLTDLRATYQPATVSNYWTKLKSLVRYAVDNGRLSVNPCSGIKVGKGEKEVRTITVEEYGRMRDKVLPIARLERVRDLAVFACNSGLSYCDVISLRKEDFSFVDGRWVVEKERKKTGVRFYSVILDDGVRILEKYNWDLSCLFLSNQKCNSYLGEIRDICNMRSIDSLHFHLFRHYYITCLVRKGIPISIVRLCAGHSNIRMTQRYTHLGMGDVVKCVSENCRS